MQNKSESDTILIIDDDDFSAKILKSCLQPDGFRVQHAADFSSAMELIYERTPDAILLDIVMPDMNGYEMCRILRNDTRTIHLPILMISGKNELADKVAGFDAGADDYITKPFACIELVARVRSHIRRFRQEKCYNPLSKLPGNMMILDELKIRVNHAARKFAVLYVDLDNFKAYNDVYGFLKGDEVIMFLSSLLMDTIKQLGNKDDFIGHIGGDDFLLITTPDKVESLSQKIIDAFDETISSFYFPEDVEQGYIVTKDRTHQNVHHSIMSLSIAVVSNEIRPIENHWQIGEIAAELKGLAKMQPGSTCIKDRRTR